MTGKSRLPLLAVILLMVTVGCSQASDAIPTVSPGDNASIQPINSLSDNPGGSRYVWGLYDITIDPASGSAAIVPMRIAQGHLNALRFLEVNPCSTCLTVTDAVLVEPKHWKVTIQLRHPFAGLDKFTGFDVRGICMFDPSFTFPASGIAFPDPAETGSGALLNPDGYTPLFNPTVYPPGSEPWPAWEYQKGKMATEQFPGSNLNPYIAFGTGNPRRFFACSTAESHQYDVRFPSASPLKFGYAVDACWCPPTVDPPSVPDDFPLEANSAEPFIVQFSVIENTLWSDPGVGGGGNLRFKVRLYDHQDPRLTVNGGTIEAIRWEIAGMTGWDQIHPIDYTTGFDYHGDYAEYEFLEAPVPDAPGQHRCIVSAIDQETGIKDLKECAFAIGWVAVTSGETCWSQGTMISNIPSENYEAHLFNAHNTFVDSEGNFHLFYLDHDYLIHHLIYNDGVQSDDVIIEDDHAFNLNAIPDSDGAVHLSYADDPPNRGGNIIYRKIAPDGTVGPAVILTASEHEEQFEDVLAVAPDGCILVVWMNTAGCPERSLCAAFFNGVGWTPEMTFATTNMTDYWINPTVVADSSGVFHIAYCSDNVADLVYLQFDHGVLSSPEMIVEGPNKSVVPIFSIHSDDRIYMTFEDNRTGDDRGWFKSRDPLTGTWSDEIDMVGHCYVTSRYQNCALPDGRVATAWTDFRDSHRGLYSKVFDYSMSAEEVQSTPDDEIDAPFNPDKFQTRLCVDQQGTLHLVWSDYRSGHWQLFYSRCTP